MQPVLEIGDSLVNGKISLFNDRLEYELRTRHVMVPIDQISGVTTDGMGARDLKVFSKTGDPIEVKFTTRADYDRLSEAIQRIRAGDTLAANQIHQERSEQVRKEVKDFTQDDNVQGCGLIVGISLAVLVVLGLIVSAVQWVFNAIGSLF